MKLLFACFSSFAMDVTTPEREALGGTESCAAYLCRQLAQNGHDVTFAAQLPPGTPTHLKGVRHVPIVPLSDDGYESVIAVGAQAPRMAERLSQLAPRAFKICWVHLLPDQGGQAGLAAMAPHMDCAVFVSQFQRHVAQYQGPSAVIGNGFAPAFENMFASAEELLAAKQDRAAYTSMPFRGLHILEQVMGQMRGETSFDIYSAMHTYREKEDRFLDLYARVKARPRARYHGALAQPALAGELRGTAFLSYPCTFVETYCIAAMEAIAAGLKVVSTKLGGLPESTLGFADLMPVSAQMTDTEFVRLYALLLERNVADFHARPSQWAQERFEQSQAVNRLCSWRARSLEWEMLLAAGIDRRTRVQRV